MENVAGLYVCVVSADEFFRKNPEVTCIDRFASDSVQRRLAIERALKMLGQPYNLINFNCEHLANYVQPGKATSGQVGWALVLLGAAAVIALVN